MVTRFDGDKHWPADKSESGKYVLYSDYQALAKSHARLLRLWIQLTEGTGIATPNGYTHAIAAAQKFTSSAVDE